MKRTRLYANPATQLLARGPTDVTRAHGIPIIFSHVTWAIQNKAILVNLFVESDIRLLTVNHQGRSESVIAKSF